MRKRRNSIESIVIDNAKINDPSSIKSEAVNFFRKIFHEDHHQRTTFSNLDFKTLTSEQAVKFTVEFSIDEIDQAVASCDNFKAPGPDGFNFKFIKSSWEVIKYDLYALINEFWESSRLPRGSNSAFVVLNQKIDNPSGFKDFRHISVMGSIYEIIAKLLTRCLQCVMESLIVPQ
ncbi:uncharacterized protein LOC125494871 [Beta vulgaris subsp. vulgaris]|uniref:uncharacterized protein LOC125494871 n=1 Tax=Beta vulgaris subsp. vulgaris TaxID=3555 RepID=UPI0020374268|nr:uncharacterized protein LOC125494871 [Beta vulgaris subsp. vulgaris]